MRNETALELRRLRQALERSERRLAVSRLSGKVTTVDAGARTVQLKLGTDPEGSDILSPKMRWQEFSVGGMKIHSQPGVGVLMDMVSPSGTIGASSLAVPGTYDKDNAAPSTSETSGVLDNGTGARIELGDGEIRLIGNVKASAGVFEHEGHDVGRTHKHIEVVKGGDVTGVPQ